MAGKITVGNVEILSLSDTEGEFPMPLDQLFPNVPPDEWKTQRERHPRAFAAENRWHTHYGCYLVRSRGQTLLVDTGIGPGPVELVGGLRGRLPEHLRQSGVNPEDVDRVFHTHAHFDHVGWNLTDGRPTFPRARYLLGRADWDTFRRPEVQANFPPYVDQTLTPLEGLGVLDLLDGETPLTEEAVAIATPGHTPGHMSLLISSGGERAIILGDVIGNAAQVTDPSWVFGFDMDPGRAAATRAQILDRIESEGMTAAAGHLPPPGFGRIVRLDGRRYWQGVGNGG